MRGLPLAPRTPPRPPCVHAAGMPGWWSIARFPQASPPASPYMHGESRALDLGLDTVGVGIDRQGDRPVQGRFLLCPSPASLTAALLALAALVAADGDLAIVDFDIEVI